MSEFDLIRRYFTRDTPHALLGVGDDAALLKVREGFELVVSVDMLVSGTHFFPDTDPYMLGHKALAVNLSDMAAMGAVPRWVTLAISLPDADEGWLEKFSAGFFALAGQYGVDLIGGDTTRGPLTLSVTIMGEVPQGKALLRSGAQAGDGVWVSGDLGDAALALAHMHQQVTLQNDEFAACAMALHQPQPRVELGIALCGIATSAIDISDGLLADLGHVLTASQVGAELAYESLPTSPVLRSRVASATRAGGPDLFQRCVLAGGDDYELCFTAPATRDKEIRKLGAQLGLPLTCIGKVVAGSGCIVHDAAGNPIKAGADGYDHFR